MTKAWMVVSLAVAFLVACHGSRTPRRQSFNEAVQAMCDAPKAILALPADASLPLQAATVFKRLHRIKNSEVKAEIDGLMNQNTAARAKHVHTLANRAGVKPCYLYLLLSNWAHRQAVRAACPPQKKDDTCRNRRKEVRDWRILLRDEMESDRR